MKTKSGRGTWRGRCDQYNSAFALRRPVRSINPRNLTSMKAFIDENYWKKKVWYKSTWRKTKPCRWREDSERWWRRELRSFWRLETWSSMGTSGGERDDDDVEAMEMASCLVGCAIISNWAARPWAKTKSSVYGPLNGSCSRLRGKDSTAAVKRPSCIRPKQPTLTRN